MTMQDNHKNSIDPRSLISARVHDGYKTIVDSYSRKLKLYMFHEDLTNSILPWQGYAEKDFQFNVTREEDGRTSKLADIIVYNLPADFKGYNTYTSCITGFIRKTVNEMFTFGEAFYEIKCERNKNDSIVKFGVAPIYPPSMHCIFGMYFQFIPKRVAEAYHIRREVRRIPKDQIIHITPPKQLGGKRSLQRIIKRIALLDDKDNTIHRFFLYDRCNININTTHLLTNLGIAKITRLYGWNQRKHLSHEHDTLEYYEIYRSIMAAKASAYLREAIVEQLNQTLNNRYLHTGLKISVTGLHTVSDTNALMAELSKNNKKNFSNIWKRGFVQTASDKAKE